MKPRFAVISMLVYLSALLAATTLGVAAAQGGRLDASMQPIEKRARSGSACVDCAAEESGGDARENARFGPEFPDERRDRRWDKRRHDSEDRDGPEGGGPLADLLLPDAALNPNAASVAPPPTPALPVK